MRKWLILSINVEIVSLLMVQELGGHPKRFLQMSRRHQTSMVNAIIYVYIYMPNIYMRCNASEDIRHPWLMQLYMYIYICQIFIWDAHNLCVYISKSLYGLKFLVLFILLSLICFKIFVNSINILSKHLFVSTQHI